MIKGKHTTRARVHAFALITMTALVAANAVGAAADTQGNGAPAMAALTAEDLAQFLGEFVPQQLERRNIAGAVISVVYHDTTLLSRGYGYANVREKKPMTDRSLVRVASVTKPFVALAVAQLVEGGQLDLDRDVNEYVDLPVPTPEGGVPVTLRMLLTHRAGYENFLKDLFGAGTAPHPLREWLRQSQPLRLFPHGDVAAYSNYGYGLAGYIVERASGVRFDEYIEQHILRPLDMRQATLAQPLPVTAETASGYPSAAAPPLPYFETITPAPAGAMSVSAADMTLFLKAITTSSDGNHVRLPSAQGSATEYELLGLEEYFAAGNRFLGKHGLALSFVSVVAWLPEHDFGVFVSYNSTTAARAPVELLNAIAERYFAREIPPPTGTMSVNASDLAGLYQASQRADSTLLRFSVLTMGQLVVTAQADGSIRVNQDTDSYAPAGEGVFRAPSGQELRFVQRPSSDGWTFRWTAVPLPIEWEQAPWYLDARFLMPAVPTAIGIVSVALLCWPVAAFRRRHQQRAFGSALADRRDYVALRAVLALHLIVFVGLALLIAQLNDLTHLNASLDPWLIALFSCAWLSIIATPFAFWTAFRFWRDRVGTLWTRIYHSLLAASAAFIAWFWFMFRIAGTKLNF